MPFDEYQDFEAFRARLQEREKLSTKKSLVLAIKRWKRAGKPFLSNPPSKKARLYRRDVTFKTSLDKIFKVGKGEKYYRTLVPKDHVFIEKAGVKFQRRSDYPQKASVWIWVRKTK